MKGSYLPRYYEDRKKTRGLSLQGIKEGSSDLETGWRRVRASGPGAEGLEPSSTYKSTSMGKITESQESPAEGRADATSVLASVLSIQ